MKRVLALLLCMAVAAPGCATTRTMQTPLATQAGPPPPDRALLTAYLKQLPPGSRVRASLTGGATLRGTLMRATDEGIVIQPHTRVPEPPRDVPIDRIRAVELDSSGGVGRAVAIGVAVGAGAAVGVLMLLAALLAD